MSRSSRGFRISLVTSRDPVVPLRPLERWVDPSSRVLTVSSSPGTDATDRARPSTLVRRRPRTRGLYRDEVSHRLRDEDFGRTTQRCHPCADANGDAADSLTVKFHVARVHACAYLDG